MIASLPVISVVSWSHKLHKLRRFVIYSSSEMRASINKHVKNNTILRNIGTKEMAFSR